MANVLEGLTEQQLFVHGRWLRRLARDLVGNHADAEDLAQRVWVELAKYKSSVDDLRAFSTTVIRRLAGRHRVEQESRVGHESRVARPESLSESKDADDVLTSQRLLVRELQELDEFNRTLLVLRYFEDVSSAEIARRRGIPASTVRSQVEHAIDLLRRRLQHRARDPMAWLAALAPLTALPRTAPPRWLQGTWAAPAGLLAVTVSVVLLAQLLGQGASRTASARAAQQASRRHSYTVVSGPIDHGARTPLHSVVASPSRGARALPDITARGIRSTRSSAKQVHCLAVI
jgi:RNA polymerase sigma factor (sigma-70 family)